MLDRNENETELCDLADNMKINPKKEISEIVDKINDWTSRIKTIKDLNRNNLRRRNILLKNSSQLLIKFTNDAYSLNLEKKLWQSMFYEIISLYDKEIRQEDDSSVKNSYSKSLSCLIKKAIVFYKFSIVNYQIYYSKLRPQKSLLGGFYHAIGDLYRYLHLYCNHELGFEPLHYSKLFYQLSFHSHPKQIQSLLNIGLIGFYKKNAIDTFFFNICGLSFKNASNNIKESIVQLSGLLNIKFIDYVKKLGSHYHIITDGSGKKCILYFPRRRGVALEHQIQSSHHIKTHDEIIGNLNMLLSLFGSIIFTDNHIDNEDTLISEIIKNTQAYFSETFDAKIYSNTFTAQIFAIFTILMRSIKSIKSRSQSFIKISQIYSCYVELLINKYVRSTIKSDQLSLASESCCYLYSLVQAIHIFWSMLEFFDETVTYYIRTSILKLNKCKLLHELLKVSDTLISNTKRGNFNLNINQIIDIKCILINLGIVDPNIYQTMQFFTQERYSTKLSKYQWQLLVMLSMLCDLLRKLNNENMYIKQNLDVNMMQFLMRSSEESEMNKTSKPTYHMSKMLLDTNIWMSHSNRIFPLLRDYHIDVYIPMVVLKELKNLSTNKDYRKQEARLQAQNCLSKLNNLLQSDQAIASNIQLIYPKEDADEKTNEAAISPQTSNAIPKSSTINDDLILESCESIIRNSKAGEICILFTNDYNLQNKAKLHNIIAFDFDFIVDNFEVFPQ
ncbi:MAG: hypothetical protein MHMPM18_001329 [Marteilia pararefringens]